MANILKGNDLMLFAKIGDETKSLAFATSHTLTLTGETTDTSSKDHGMWAGNQVNKFSWEITSENLFTMENYTELFDKMVAAETVDIIFGVCGSHTEVNDAVEGELKVDHKVDEKIVNYKGKVYITSLTANANTGENATYSCTLTGTGALSKVAATE